MRKIKVGAIGYSSIFRRKFFPALKKLGERFEFLALGSRNKLNSFDEIGREIVMSYESVLNHDDIELVYISLPISLHYEYAKKALECNKHVLCEKPLTDTYQKTKNLVEFARRKNLLLKESFQFIHHLQSMKLKEVIDSGKLGNIRVIRCDFSIPPIHNKNDIRFTKELGGGSLLDLGCYPLKFLTYFFPSQWKIKYSELYFSEDLEVDIGGTGILVNNFGTVAQIYFGMQDFYSNRFELNGFYGRLSGDRIFTAPSELSVNFSRYDQSGKSIIPVGRCNHFEEQLKFVYDMIKGGRILLNSDSTDQAFLVDSFFDNAARVKREADDTSR